MRIFGALWGVGAGGRAGKEFFYEDFVNGPKMTSNVNSVSRTYGTVESELLNNRPIALLLAMAGGSSPLAHDVQYLYCTVLVLCSIDTVHVPVLGQRNWSIQYIRVLRVLSRCTTCT